MATSTNGHTKGQPTIVRTERGLSLAGTRITLYSILEYLHADWPPKLIQEWLQLTDNQMADVLTYLDEHRDAVEAEYRQVAQQADDIRQYWENRNRDRAFPRDPNLLTPEQRVLWEKLQAWKERIRQQ
jgi:uncharacterized protein (DUF433 family)